MSDASEAVEPTFDLSDLLSQELQAGDVDVPGYPQVALRVSRATSDADTTVAQMAQLVSAEPVLSARLLKMANSAALRPAAQPVKDVKTAVGRLGFSLVQCAAAAFAVEQMLVAHRYVACKDRFEDVRQASVRVAAVARAIAKRTVGVSPDEALLAGVVHSIGKIYVLSRAAEHHEALGDGQDLDAVLDQWHVALGAAILRSWRFPSETVAAVAHQVDVGRAADDAVDLTDVLIVAVSLADGWPDEAELTHRLQAVRAPERLCLPADACLALFVDAAQEIAELKNALA